MDPYGGFSGNGRKRHGQRIVHHNNSNSDFTKLTNLTNLVVGTTQAAPEVVASGDGENGDEDDDCNYHIFD